MVRPRTFIVLYDLSLRILRTAILKMFLNMGRDLSMSLAIKKGFNQKLYNLNLWKRNGWTLYMCLHGIKPCTKLYSWWSPHLKSFMNWRKPMMLGKKYYWIPNTGLIIAAQIVHNWLFCVRMWTLLNKVKIHHPSVPTVQSCFLPDPWSMQTCRKNIPASRQQFECLLLSKLSKVQPGFQPCN